MGKEYRAKVFKSGNSLALRLPKALGIEVGSTMTLREEQSGYRLEVEPAPRKTIDVSGFAGKAPWLKPLPPELREFEERPRTIAARKAAEKAAKKA